MSTALSPHADRQHFPCWNTFERHYFWCLREYGAQIQSSVVFPNWTHCVATNSGWIGQRVWELAVVVRVDAGASSPGFAVSGVKHVAFFEAAGANLVAARTAQQDLTVAFAAIGEINWNYIQ